MGNGLAVTGGSIGTGGGVGLGVGGDIGEGVTGLFEMKMPLSM